MDIWTKKKRSQVMSQIRSKNTKPEQRTRKMLTEMGYRYRLHVKGLPGKPDIVLRKHGVVIFVHGCFWHLHKGCRDGGLDGFEQHKQDESRKEGNPGGDNPRNRGVHLRKNNHPTVKPTNLMRYLCRLITPPVALFLTRFVEVDLRGRAHI